MPDVKQRMIDIVNSVPDDYFDGLKPTEMVFKLMMEYINRYGEDETTIIPGTDKHFNYEKLKEMLENKNQVNTQDNTLYDYIYNLLFFISLKESEEDIKNGRVMTIEESKERLMQKYGNLTIK